MPKIWAPLILRVRARDVVSIFVIVAPAPRTYRPFDQAAVGRRKKGVALQAHLAFGVIALDIARHFLGRFKRLGVGGTDVHGQPHQGAERAALEKAATVQTVRCGSSHHPPRYSAFAGPSAPRDDSKSIRMKSRAMHKAWRRVHGASMSKWTWCSPPEPASQPSRNPLIKKVIYAPRPLDRPLFREQLGASFL